MAFVYKFFLTLKKIILKAIQIFLNVMGANWY